MPISKKLLSESIGGRQIKVVATTTPGTLIHTTGTSSSTIDQITLMVTNQDAAAVTITVEWGGATDPDDLTTLTIPAKSGETLVIASRPLTGDGVAGRSVRVFAGTANKVMVFGDVNRIS
jgi:hypothetical protein